jgi:hypothetical protein
MTMLANSSSLVLWHDVVKNAESRCSIVLNEDLEAYLIALLIRYSNKPDIAQQVFASAFLEAMQMRSRERNSSLQHVGDQCLLYAGLFPRAAEKKHVKINYFVDLGRSAYGAISRTANDLYWMLALEFVMLMDVLQSIRPTQDLLPLEAYEQWDELGSKRARLILEEYTRGMPIKRIK